MTLVKSLPSALVTDAALSVQIRKYVTRNPDKKKEAPTHLNELARRRVTGIINRSPEKLIELDKGKFALFTGEGLVWPYFYFTNYGCFYIELKKINTNFDKISVENVKGYSQNEYFFDGL